MSSDTDQEVFSRPLKVDEIRDGTSGEIAATEAEMQHIARLLNLVALKGLSVTYGIAYAGEGRLRLSGRLTADVTQTCVVTLDPVAAALDLPVELDFWPARLLEGLEQSAEQPEALLDWPEPIVDGTIDPGPALYEILATSLDPFPKREGASFEWSQQPSPTSEAEADQSGPFAALAALKHR
jgi:uncharacterized metal-binding protein YceD (DUF177 family)